MSNSSLTDNSVRYTQGAPSASSGAEKNFYAFIPKSLVKNTSEVRTLPTVMLCLGIIWFLPIVWMITAALQTSLPQLAVLIPNRLPELTKFMDALNFADWPTLYANTAIFTLGTLAVQLVTITLAGYAFAYVDFPAKKLFFTLFLVQLLVVPTVLIVPNMLTLRKLGLLDSLVGLMMPYFASAFGTFLMRQAFKSIPKEYMEAATMDGATWFQTLRFILIPMVRPSLIAFSIVSITSHWNEFLWPLMVINSLDNQVLTIGFASFAKGAEAGADWGLVAAGALLICAPILALYLVFQKTFINSFSFGDLK